MDRHRIRNLYESAENYDPQTFRFDAANEADLLEGIRDCKIVLLARIKWGLGGIPNTEEQKRDLFQALSSLKKCEDQSIIIHTIEDLVRVRLSEPFADRATDHPEVFSQIKEIASYPIYFISES